MVNEFAAILAKIAVGVFFLTLLVSGVFIGGTALHDPDTCWLLALGRWIFENHGLPSIEPFSYTFAQLGRPLVLYQWLSEAIFYGSYSLAGLIGLLLLVTVSVVVSFIVLPMKLFAHTKSSWTAALGAMFVGLVAASFHFLARPEILSYVLLSSFLFLLAKHRFSLMQEPEAASRVDWKFIGCVGAVMLLWVNCHTGFTSLVVVLCVYLFADSLARAVLRQHSPLDLSSVVSLLVATVVTLCNPYGFGLWSYIPSLFFAKFNYLIDELHAVDFRRPEFIPFLVFMAICVAILRRRWCHALAAKVPIEKIQLIDSIAVMTVCAVEAWTHLRLIPFVVLICLGELSLLLASGSADSDSGNKLLALFDQKLAEGLAPPVKLGTTGCALFAFAIGVCGTLLTVFSIQAPRLPQSGVAFVAPFNAVETIGGKSIEGNILNDAQFGDLLIWYHPGAPLVFIDTRYDMYGEALVNDYLTLVQAKPGWQELMKKYDIKTVFLRPHNALVEKLKQEPDWHVDFSDDKAVVISQPVPKKPESSGTKTSFNNEVTNRSAYFSLQ
ncbi:MAG TPA: hypothetical protein V6C86_19220 [Oculatellaceae cyanobacterium]